MVIPSLRYSFTCASNFAFDVARFTLHEAISAPYLLDIELVSADPSIPFESLLDQPATLTFWQGEHAVRHVHGIVTGFAQAASGHRHTVYRAVVEPALARGQLRSNWRIHQQLAVPELLAKLLKSQRIVKWEEDFCCAHRPREYCVQAGETDLDFFHRLAAEEGVLYAFAHTAHNHTPVLTDDVRRFGALEDGPVLYVPLPGGNANQPHFSRFIYTEQLRSNGLIQRDYTFRNPPYDLEQQRPSSLVATDYVQYRYPGRYKQDEVGRPFTATHLAALRADAHIALAEGNDPRLMPGLSFLLEGHPRNTWNTHWRVIRLTHEGSQLAYLESNAGAGGGGHYRQQIELVPAEMDWKAIPAPKPRIDGPQVATVVGPPGEEIFCDEHGRVRVRFPWDRDGSGTCWIRVAQGWAGAGFGQMALPRVGHEVLVAFLDGDPDQPIVIGRQYNASHPTPYKLPLHKTRSTWRSKTHHGNGFNEIRFEDAQRQEEIYLHAQKDFNTEVLNDATWRIDHDARTQVGHDEQREVGHDDTLKVGHDRSESVGHDEQVNIDNDRRHQIGQDAFLDVARNHVIHVGKDHIEQVDNHRHDKIAADHRTEVGGHIEQTVQGHHALKAGQSIERQTQTYQLQAGEAIKLCGPGGTITLDDSGITIEGKAIRLKGPVNMTRTGAGNTFHIDGTPASGAPESESRFCLECFLHAAATGNGLVPAA